MQSVAETKAFNKTIVGRERKRERERENSLSGRFLHTSVLFFSRQKKAEFSAVVISSHPPAILYPGNIFLSFLGNEMGGGFWVDVVRS